MTSAWHAIWNNSIRPTKTTTADLGAGASAKVSKITKGEAMLKNLMQKALKGDAKAINLMMVALRQFGDDEPAAAGGAFGVLVVPGMVLSDADWEVLAQEQRNQERQRDDDDD